MSSLAECYYYYGKLNLFSTFKSQETVPKRLRPGAGAQSFQNKAGNTAHEWTQISRWKPGYSGSKLSLPVGLWPRILQGLEEPGHLRPSAALEAQAAPRLATGSFQAEGVSGASPHHAPWPRISASSHLGARGPLLRVGEPGPALSGRGPV